MTTELFWIEIMSDERAVLWLIVVVLIGLGFVLGQAAAVSVAAAVGIYLVYETVTPRLA